MTAMRYVIAAFASLVIAGSACAALSFSPDHLELTVGSSAYILATQASIGTTGGVIKFDSCDPTVATASGQVIVASGSHGGSGSILVTARGPGQTHVCTNGARVVPVTVTCGPLPPAEAVQARVEGRVGQAVTLSVVFPLLPNTTVTWYRGHRGDTSSVLPGGGRDLAFIPDRAAIHPIWVSVATPCSTSSVEFAVEAHGRRRAVRK